MSRKSVGKIEISRKHVEAASRLSPEAASWFLQFLAASAATVTAKHAGLASKVPPLVRRELDRAWILDGAGWFLPAVAWCRDIENTRLEWRREKAVQRRQMSGPDSGQDVRSGHARSRPDRTSKSETIPEPCENVRPGQSPYRIGSRAPGSDLASVAHAFPDLDDAPTTTTTDPVFDDLDEPTPPTPSRVDPSEVPDPDDADAMRAALEAARRRLSAEDRRAIEKSDPSSHISTCVRVA